MLLATFVGSEVVEALGDDDLIFQQGVIDSLHLVELIDGFSAKLHVEVEAQELTPENFESVAAMARYLTQKRGG